MDWKVKIIDRGYTDLKDIFIWSKDFNGKIHILKSDGTIQIDDQGIAQSPTLQLNHQQLEAFSNALNEQGISPRKEYVEGKLEATEKHLSDMRTLLKIK